MNTLTDRILSRAHELGFVCAGVVPAEPLPHGEAFRRWIDAEQHGSMDWLARTRDARDHPEALLDGARSIVALAASYHTPDARQRPGEVAMYAQGYDYHKVLEHRLETLAGFIRAETGQEVNARAAVDRLPLLERDVAYLAGIGWYGKNTMILNRDQGSYLFLAELIVDIDLERVGAPMKDYCGTCTRCIDACPTGAIVAPGRLDARRCIAYLTIEHRGPIPRDLRPGVGLHMFGCDICQAVCPWNSKAPHTRDWPFVGRPEVLALSADRALQMDQAEFHATLQLSPVQRPQRAGLLRNAAVVLGNTGDRRWIPLLIERLRAEPQALVRGHIAWALGRLGGAAARGALAARLEQEPDPYVQDEIRVALDES
ncbi:MAG: tRNA epoxyqueuosine(34) reductase QueG [Myxococcales bacterium]|nr:tRNA epoxyqueuosine(34) reductase QueG [Myxococcales bacterium]